MPQIKFTIQEADKRISLTLEGASDALIQEVLRQSVSLFTGEVTEHVSVLKEAITLPEILVPEVQSSIPAPQKENFSVPIGELIQDTTQEKSHLTTGIKIDPDGTRRYRCKIYCQNRECKQQHIRYITKGTEVVTCRACETPHIVEAAGTAEGLPDQSGKFYLARRTV